VQMEGRCSAPIAEDDVAALPPRTGCPRLPAMTFEYSHVQPFRITGEAGAAIFDGFEGFDERLHAVQNSPDTSIYDPNAGLFDINADSLPDVLVTDPSRFEGGHGVLLNGAGGAGAAFGAATRLGVNAVLGENAQSLMLNNDMVAPLDLNGDAMIDFVRMLPLQ